MEGIGPSQASKGTSRRGRFVTLIVAVAIVVLSLRRGNVSTAATHSDRNNQNGFVPSWDIADAEPFWGNLTCMFEMAHYNINSHKHTPDIERQRTCAKLRYRPSRDWVRPDPNAIFDNLANGTTIYILGDSISIQHGSDLLCSLASTAEIVRADITRQTELSWCNDANDCDVDYRGYNPIFMVRATFRSYGNDRTEIHVVVAETNDKTWGKVLDFLRGGKPGDIFVLNQGLQYMNGREGELREGFTRIAPELTSARDRGVRLVWRETTAAHFDTADGYWMPSLVDLQKEKTARCIPSSKLNATLARNRSNGAYLPMMESLGIPVLKAWEASFLLPEWCHVGGGKDCVHSLQPGGTSYMTEALVKYIEEGNEG